MNLLKPDKCLQRGFKDKKRLEMVASYNCLACQKKNRLQTTRTCVHHFWGTGAGMKESDLKTMPLCENCHDELHRGLDKFEEKYYTQKQMINIVNERIYKDRALKGKDLERYYLIKDYLCEHDKDSLGHCDDNFCVNFFAKC